MFPVYRIAMRPQSFRPPTIRARQVRLRARPPRRTSTTSTTDTCGLASPGGTVTTAPGLTIPFTVDGVGSVTVALLPTRPSLVSTTADAGWAVGETSEAENEVEVEFTDGSNRVDVEFEYEDGQLRVRVRDRSTGVENFTWFSVEDGSVIREGQSTDSDDDDRRRLATMTTTPIDDDRRRLRSTTDDETTTRRRLRSMTTMTTTPMTTSNSGSGSDDDDDDDDDGRSRLKPYRRRMAQHFPYDVDKRWTALFFPLGLKDDDGVEITDDGKLIATYGRVRVETPLSNIDHTLVSGPHRWYTAVGLRLSFTDDGLTFGTNHRKGLCIEFVEKIPR